MRKKTFLVTNGSDGSISLVGRTRIRIPGNCKEHRISLSAEKARDIISRLKRTYPLLKIVEAPEPESVNLTAPKAADADPRDQQATASAQETKTSTASSSVAEAKTVTPASEGGAQNSVKKK